MSMYCSVATQFKNQDALIKALMETKGWKANQIEVHDEPQNLMGYKGDLRSQRANIIIRRQFVGAASNDIGFIKDENGAYQAIISQYDMGYLYGQKFIGELKGNYIYHVLKAKQEQKGRTVMRTKVNGKTRLQIKGYR